MSSEWFISLRRDKRADSHSSLAHACSMANESDENIDLEAKEPLNRGDRRRDSHFCVLKKWVHSKIDQYVRPSIRPAVHTITLPNYIRLSWNFVHRIVSSISRSSSKMRLFRQEMTELSKKLSSLTRTSLRGVQEFFFKKYLSQNYLKHTWINSVFNADSEYDISFEPNCSFWTNICLNRVSKCTKTASRDQYA